MAAVLQFDQVGLPAGSPGFARTDGLVGAVVTVSSVGLATTHEARILYSPDGDASATLAQVTPTTWTFTPAPGDPVPPGGAPYRVELVTDRGLPTEDRTIRVFGIRDQNGLLVPPFGALADPAANRPDLADPTLFARYVDANELNEPDGDWPSGYPFGWDREFRRTLVALDAGLIAFEWNRVDLTQWENDGASPGYADGAGAGGALSVVDSGLGPAIKADGVGTTVSLVWLPKAPLPFAGNARDLVVEMELVSMTGAAGAYVGIAVGALDTWPANPFAAVHYAFGAAEWATRIDDGTPSKAGGTGSANREGLCQWTLRGERRAAPDTPRQASYALASRVSVGEQIRRLQDPVGVGSVVVRPFGDGTDVPASWAGVDLNAVGIALGSSGGNPAPVDVLISRFRVIVGL